MRYFLHPKNKITSEAIRTSLVSEGCLSDLKNIEYRGHKIWSFEISSNLLEYFENSIKSGSVDFFLADLYSENEKRIIERYKFPRTHKSNTKIKKK